MTGVERRSGGARAPTRSSGDRTGSGTADTEAETEDPARRDGRTGSRFAHDTPNDQFGTLGFCWAAGVPLAAPFWMPCRKSMAESSCLSLAGSGGT